MAVAMAAVITATMGAAAPAVVNPAVSCRASRLASKAAARAAVVAAAADIGIAITAVAEAAAVAAAAAVVEAAVAVDVEAAAAEVNPVAARVVVAAATKAPPQLRHQSAITTMLIATTIGTTARRIARKKRAHSSFAFPDAAISGLFKLLPVQHQRNEDFIGRGSRSRAPAGFLRARLHGNGGTCYSPARFAPRSPSC